MTGKLLLWLPHSPFQS